MRQRRGANSGVSDQQMQAQLNNNGKIKKAPRGLNENYARELMQLFSIGTDMLNPDGTPILDVNGNRIPTYGQTEITNFARVFTGWIIPTKSVTINGVSGISVHDYITPMAFTNNTGANGPFDIGAKTLLNGQQLPACTNCTGNAANMAAYKNAELNAAIPESEWEKDRDGKPRPPWAHHVAIKLVNPDTATKYVYCSVTTGAHIAFEQLRENVATMRMLRNALAMPLVKLTSRPMKTKYKMSERPHFEIIGWHAPGGGGNALAPPTAPQLPGPAAAELPPPAIEALQTQPKERRDDPISSGLQPQLQQQQKRPIKPKPPVNATLGAMDQVKLATSAEILDDGIPW